jgi:hypothetical protein
VREVSAVAVRDNKVSNNGKMGIEEWDFAQEFSRAEKWESRNGILSILTNGVKWGNEYAQ